MRARRYSPESSATSKYLKIRIYFLYRSRKKFMVFAVFSDAISPKFIFLKYIKNDTSSCLNSVVFFYRISVSRCNSRNVYNLSYIDIYGCEEKERKGEIIIVTADKLITMIKRSILLQLVRPRYNINRN